jgi:hypothetical protein
VQRNTPIQTTAPPPQEPQEEAHIFFVMEQTPSFKRSDDTTRQQICANTFEILLQTIFSRVPDVILQPDPVETWVRPLSLDTPEDKYPDNIFAVKEIA